jgi:hypothetical protein
MSTPRTLSASLILAIALPLLASAGPSLAQTGPDSVARQLGLQLAIVEDALRRVDVLRRSAVEAGEVGRLACIDDRAMYLSGMEVGGRAALDEYLLARDEEDSAAMEVAVVRMADIADRAPDYLAEAEACTERPEAVLRGQCDDRAEGEACVRWTVRTAFEYPEHEFGGFPRSTVPPPASSVR